MIALKDSVRGRLTPPPTCAAKEEHLNGSHTTGPGRVNMDYTIRVIATSLISATVTVSAQSKAEGLAKAEQQISPKLRQEGYEFQVEFLETVERAQSARRLSPGGLPSDGNCLGEQWRQTWLG